jgi:cell division protein FtsI (penicillin-binding protein 3)
MKLRFHFVRILLCCGFAAIVARLGYLQLWKHGDLSRRAQQQSNRLISEAPRRGPILDRHGRVLVESIRVGSCFADPTFVQDPVFAARRLAPLLEIPYSSLLEKLRDKDRAFVWLKRFLPADKAQALEKMGLPGVGIRWEYQRSYPEGPLAAHLLGFVGVEGRGLSGTELAFDDWLVETSAPRRALRDGRGAGIGLSNLAETENRESYVQLTLDRTIQYIAERELDFGMQRSKAKAGHILVQDPWTGEILAMASRPKLLLTKKNSFSTKDLAIPSLHWVFEPGSTFKIVTAAAALDAGLVSPEETFDCENGRWKYLDLTINDHSKEKILTFVQVMERSSNIGFAKVALRLGKTNFYNAIRSFGFGTLSGCELPGESAGLLRSVSRWSGASLPVISFGQEIGVTPIQLAGAYSAIANGGKLLEPRLFREVRNQAGEERTWESPSVVRQVMSPKTAAELIKMLQGVVQRGTGQNALVEGWTAAGKTGTAQKIDPKTRTYSPDKFVASFCGFVPANQPRLTIVVIYDEPQGVSWGGYNAGPVFRNVASHGLSYLGIPPDRDSRLADRRRKGDRS